MSVIVIPAGEIDDPEGPEPVAVRHVTVVEGIDPDGTPWITLVGDGADEDLRGLVAAAVARFPVQRTSEPW